MAHTSWVLAAILLPLCLAGQSAASAAAAGAGVKPPAHRADWMARGSYGGVGHYLIAPPGDTAEAETADLNRIIDGFDLDHFMTQFQESRADWLIFTIGQNTGYYKS